MNRSALALALLLLFVPVLYATTKSDVELSGNLIWNLIARLMCPSIFTSDRAKFSL